MPNQLNNARTIVLAIVRLPGWLTPSQSSWSYAGTQRNTVAGVDIECGGHPKVVALPAWWESPTFVLKAFNYTIAEDSATVQYGCSAWTSRPKESGFLRTRHHRLLLRCGVSQGKAGPFSNSRIKLETGRPATANMVDVLS